MITILAFLVTVCVIVFIHELGHYYAARLFSVRVLQFSVGFGKALWQKTDKHGTNWVFAPVLLGGYVRLLDEQTAKELKLDPATALENKDNWQNFIIYAAGPLANILLSIVVVAGLYNFNGEVGFRPIIGQVLASSPAQEANITRNDEIIAVNEKPVMMWQHANIAIVDAIVDRQAITMKMTNGDEKTIAADKISIGDIDGNLYKSLGFLPDRSYLSPQISHVATDSGAAKAGIMPGDTIVAINERVTDYWTDVEDAVSTRPGETVTILLWREKAVTVTAVLSDVVRDTQHIGLLGVSPSLNLSRLAEQTKTINMSPPTALWQATKKTINDAGRTFTFIFAIISGNLNFKKNIGGPLIIAQEAGKSLKRSLADWLQFVASISISLAVINLFPLSVLDGGRMMICVIQCVFRKRMPEIILRIIDRLSMFLVFFLMLYVITNDIVNLWE